MCWQIALPLLTTAAGTAIQTSNQNNALEAQDREAARGLRESMALRDQAANRVNQRIQEVAKSDSTADEAKAENDFAAALRRAKVARGGDDLSGPGGGRFQDDLGIARTQADAEGKTLSKQLARIDAPNFQRFREGVGGNNALADLSLLDDRSKALDFLTRMRIAQQRPNAAADAIGQGLAAYGMASAGRASKPKGGLYTMTPAESAGAVDYGGMWNNDVFGALARNGG